MTTNAPQRPLTVRQAKNCEEAREPVCKCRCGGLGHGIQRGGEDAPADFFYGLPEDDPHYVPSAQKRRELRNAAKREKTRLKNEKIMAAWEKLRAPIAPLDTQE